MSISQTIRRELMPRLDHRRVFGELPGWSEQVSVQADCPLCGGLGALEMEANRAHANCSGGCGRLSWWRFARQVRGLDPAAALGWLAERAGYELPEGGEAARLEGLDETDRRADLMEAVYRAGRERAERSPERTAGLSGRPELGLVPGTRELSSRLRKLGFAPEEFEWLTRAGVPRDALAAFHRTFEGEADGFYWFEESRGRRVEHFVRAGPAAPPHLPFRFNEVVGARSLVVTGRAWDCLQLLATGLETVCALVPDLSGAAQLASLLEWHVGTLYLQEDTPALTDLLALVKRSGGCVPFVLRCDGGLDFEATLARRPGPRCLEGAVHGTRWDLSRRLLAHDVSCEAGRQDAVTEVFGEWKVCDSPSEKEQMLAALSERLGQPVALILEEFRVRRDRHARTSLETSYRQLFAAGETLAAEGRFAELKELLYRKNAEIAGRGQLERLEPFEADRMFRVARDLPDGLKTGYPDLDRYIRVLPGELVILAARPSHGKTTFSLNLLHNFLNLNRVFQRDDPFIFFSFELNEEFLAAKLLSRMTARYSFYEVLEYLRSGLRMDPCIEEALARLKAFGPSLYLVARPRMTAEDLLAFCQSVWYKHGRIGAVLVDYIQIVGLPGPMASREQEVAYVTRQLRIAAQEFHTPVIALAQAMRAGPDAPMERPGVQHLMDSRVIEQEANTILALFNPAIQKAQTSRSDPLVEDDIVPFEVVVRKNKYGAINRIIQLEYKMRTNEIKNRGGFETVYEL
jgi:replicative DNA helicase